MSRRVLLSTSLLVVLAGCADSEVDPGPIGQVDSGDMSADAGDSGGDLVSPDADFDADADATADAPPDLPPDCGRNADWSGSTCVCRPGFYETQAARCVSCLIDDHCGDRICAANSCRNCQSNTECGDGMFCGDDGRCTEDPSACAVEGEQRCFNHVVQLCSEGSWQDDTAGTCPFGCNDDSGACYVDTNIGWIGGRCEMATDCSRQDSAVATCLPPDEGFVEGMCTQRCTSICPDMDTATDSVTFCIESEGLNDAGVCVSRCDFDLFSDSGCRAGYECREFARYSQPGVVQAVCLPINWWRNPSRRFDYGVTAGEMTDTTAVVWAHTGVAEADVIVRYGTSAESLDALVETMTSGDSGFTVQVALTDLDPAADYYYQFRVDDLADSPIGHFRTAPANDESRAVRFVFSADVHQDYLAHNGIFEVMQGADADFFINLGDWSYADSATTLSGYRALAQVTRGESRVRDFLTSTPVYATFDDHEVFNDWDAAYAVNNPTAVANGLQVWSEWWPLDREVDGEFYRAFRWGDLAFFMLDARTHRDPSAAVDNASKSMLGEGQYDWLVAGLEGSDAAFNFILTSVPLDFVTNGLDAWTGYTTERDRLLADITAMDTGGVVFLAADQHWFASHHYHSGFKEFQVGPATAFLRAPSSQFFPERVEVIETRNFGLIDYDPDAGTIVFEAINASGSVIYSEEVRPGRGRIEVTANVGAAFTLCPPPAVEDCAHTFAGVAPETFEYAPPGPYRIVWEPAAGFVSPPPATATLTNGGTIAFDGQYESAGLPFFDDFDANSGWIVVDEGTIDGPSDWAFVDLSGEPVLAERSNIYDVNSATPGPIAKVGTLVYNGDVTWTDYDLSVSVRSSDDDGLGVIARYLDNDNYYRFSLDAQRRFARLVARVDGAFFLLDEETAMFGSMPPYAANTWHDLSLVVDGTSIEGYLDGSLVVSATDNRVPSGAVGLYSWGSQTVYFDDLAVEQ